MSPTEILREAKERLERLPEERLRVAADFLAYLEERETSEANLQPNTTPSLGRSDQG